ncbi:MAG: hypothetical protein GEU88_06980 [Solirubrobacterales bacterium]|nr:hypothetical protein [Solirubrobacterales bacterium]
MSERFDAVVVGSGAGGGVVAGELAQHGRRVLLLEIGPHRTAADFTRWEARASHDLWWPLRMAIPTDGAEPIALFGGRCVGGTTTINTKIAMRADECDLEKWHAASGLLGARGEPFEVADLEPHYDHVEQVLGVRERSDWTRSVHTVEPGFRALDAELEPVRSYTDHNCMRCGSCLQGCPTNAGKSTMVSWIHPACDTGRLELRPNSAVRRVLISDRGAGPEVTGVEYVDAGGDAHAVEAGAVVVAAGTLNTPQLLVRSGVPEASGDSPSSRLIGRNLGFHPARLVSGLFDEPQDNYIAYPVSSHCKKFQRDEDGGFIVEATTVQDPIGFATGLCDDGGPLWGAPLVEALRKYRYFAGLLVMTTDDNNGSVVAEEDGGERFEADLRPDELERIDRSLQFTREVLEAAGAKQVLWTAPGSTHMQGTCRMGTDPARSVVDANCESHDVKRLFVGDGSLVPKTLSVNPSLTMMALANRLAEHLDADPNGYLEPRAAGVVVGG